MSERQPNPLEYIEQLLDEQRFQEAEGLLLEQLERKHNLPAVYNALGIIAIEYYHDYELAEQNYRLALDYQDKSATIHFNLAVLYDQFLNRPHQAVTHYRKAIEYDENYVDAYINLAELCIDLNEDVELAYECSKKAEEIDPMNARNLNNLGCILIKYKQDPNLAVQYFEKSVDLAQNKATSLANLADAYVKTERFDEARDAYEQVMELDPENGLVCHNYAYILRHHFHDYDAAIHYYQRAIEIEPKALISYQGLKGLYSLDLQEAKKGVEVLVKALKHFEDDESLTLEIANVYDFELDDYENAITYYKKVLEINPNNLLALNALSYLNVEILKNYEEALEYYTKILEIDDQTPSTYVNIGHLHFYHLSNFKEALEYYHRAHQLIKKRQTPVKYAGELYFNLGALYENYLNDEHHAIQFYERAVSMAKDPKAEKKLISFYRKTKEKVH